jgi:hypothetical protein
LQKSRKANGDKHKNVRRENCRTLRRKRRQYMKEEINVEPLREKISQTHIEARMNLGTVQNLEIT